MLQSQSEVEDRVEHPVDVVESPADRGRCSAVGNIQGHGYSSAERRRAVIDRVVAAAAGIVAANRPALYEGPLVVLVPAVTAAGMVGVAIGGYYAGKRLDKRVVEIHIVAEDR